MEFKISLKTILLFTALIVLGTIILGFYSCSSNNTPVTPQGDSVVSDDSALDDVPVITDELIYDQPSDVDYTVGDVGSDSVRIDYTLTIGPDGHTTLSAPRQVTLPIGLAVEVDTIFGDLYETEPGIWNLDVAILNNGLFEMYFPRLVFSRLDDTPADEHETVIIHHLPDLGQHPLFHLSSQILRPLPLVHLLRLPCFPESPVSSPHWLLFLPDDVYPPLSDATFQDVQDIPLSFLRIS